MYLSVFKAGARGDELGRSAVSSVRRCVHDIGPEPAGCYRGEPEGFEQAGHVPRRSDYAAQDSRGAGQDAAGVNWLKKRAIACVQPSLSSFN